MQIEEWRPVLGFEGKYCVSDHGRIRRYGGDILKINRDCQGYARTYLYRSGKRITLRVHTLVLESFVGKRKLGMQCCHYDGDKLNARLDNIRWDTPSANRLDSVRHGTHACGRKLTSTDVLKIKRLISDGKLSCSKIADKFNVTASAISKIKLGSRWRNVPDAE